MYVTFTVSPMSIEPPSPSPLVSEVIPDSLSSFSKPARIETIAGDGVAGFRGDGGPALSARFDQPYGLAFGPDGRLYIADRNNHRIRVLTPITNLP